MATQNLPRERAVGMLRLATDFFEAASVTAKSARNVAFPSYFLYGHGLELALKAFLVSEGATEGQLKKVGHNLTAIIAAGEVHSSFSAIELSQDDRRLIDHLNRYYALKEFEYVVPGFKRLPPLADVDLVAERIAKALNRVVRSTVLAVIAAQAT